MPITFPMTRLLNFSSGYTNVTYVILNCMSKEGRGLAVKPQNNKLHKESYKPRTFLESEQTVEY